MFLGEFTHGITAPGASAPDFAAGLIVLLSFPILRGEAGNGLAAVAAVDAKVRIGGQQKRVVKRFRHAHQAGIGQAHRSIGIFPDEFQRPFKVPVEVEGGRHGTALRSADSAGQPWTPSRWKVSDSTASHVLQGGGKCCDSTTAHSWLPSRRLSSATRNPASTRTFLAVTAAPEVALCSRTQVGRQAVDGPDQIGDRVKRRNPSAAGSNGAAQSFANDIGF